MTVSPNKVNEFRLGFNRLDEFRHDTAFQTTPDFLSVSDTGLSTAMDFLRFDSDSYTLADNFTVVHGSHTLKTGLEIRSLRTHQFDFLNPSTTYLTTAHLIADTPDSVGLTIGGQRKLRNYDYGFFLQDNWRLSKRFQVNAGRWRHRDL
jgi:outer membrane receptor protein involved in Fe transport